MRTKSKSASSSVSTAVLTIRRFKRCCGLCSPGVSNSAICAPGACTTPRILVLVVCGFSDTIAIFSFKRRLSNVDFPTLDRPTMATVPNFMAETALRDLQEPLDTPFPPCGHSRAAHGRVVQFVKDHAPIDQFLHGAPPSRAAARGCLDRAAGHGRALKNSGEDPFHRRPEPPGATGTCRPPYSGHRSPNAVASPTIHARDCA